MLNPALISSSLPQEALPEEFGAVMGVSIYLYRDTKLRPPHTMNPDDVWREPHERPYPGFETEAYRAPEGPRFTFHVDRISLKGLEPLWFQLVATCLQVNPFSSTTFLLMGGGGRGPEDDGELLQAMLDSLRTFPHGWHYIKRDSQDAEPQIGIFAEADPVPASDFTL